VTVEWRKLHNEELRDLYSSLNIIRMSKSRGIIWVGHIAREERVSVIDGKDEGKETSRQTKAQMGR
jgi:hypothetical protein